MYADLLFLAIGLIGLWIGADRLIKGVRDFATRVGMSYFFVGVAFVSIGTSIPEIAVSIAGAVSGLQGVDASGIVVGNAVGSALTQVTFYIGAMALFVPLYMKRKSAFRHGAMLFVAILMVFGLGVDGSYDFIDGLVMVAVYIAYYLITILTEEVKRDSKQSVNLTDAVRDVLWSVIGLGVVLVSSDIVVANSISLAEQWGISQSIVGLLIVGFGTGLPEFSVAIASAKNRVMNISVGNLIGSNICDLLLSLGIGSMLTTFVVGGTMMTFDIPVLLLFSAALMAFWYTRQKITRLEGAVLVGFYLVYVSIKLLVRF